MLFRGQAVTAALGVFDAAMLVALPQFGREQLVATLVVFRILYFMRPFAVAITLMGARELWLNVGLPWQQRRKTEEMAADSATVLPMKPGTIKSAAKRREPSFPEERLMLLTRPS